MHCCLLDIWETEGGTVVSREVEEQDGNRGAAKDWLENMG